MLNKYELYFLKLFAHNFSHSYISNFLGLEKEKVLIIEKRVRRKLKTKYCSDTIIKAFNLEILSKYDYVDEAIKEISSNYALIIIEEYSKASQTDLITLQNILKTFIKKCGLQLAANNRKLGLYKKSFDRSEINFLKMRYKNYNLEEISNKLKLPQESILEMEMCIPKALHSNSWYNAYRKANEIKLLKKTDFNNTFFKINLIKSRNEILKLITNRALNDKKVKVEMIYSVLISFYNTLEYYNLHEN